MSEQHPSAPRVPGYVLLRPLGRGRAASVWKARSERTGKEVALKVLAGLGPEERARLKAAVERLVGLDRHPNVLAVLDADLDAEPAWYAADLLESGSLAERAESGRPAAPDEAARWLEDAARALAYIHGRGLIHGNLKPSNILLDDEGRARVADVGGDAEAGVSGDAAALAAAVRAASGGERLDEDLDAVLAKCGSADGYGSMSELLADLEARRSRLPVSALAHDRLYRARRFARRNAAVLALLALLAGALGWGGWQVAAKNAALTGELAGAYALRARAAALQGDPAAAAVLFAKSNALRPSDAARRDALAYAADLERPLSSWSAGFPVERVALSPDGRHVLAAGADADVRFDIVAGSGGGGGGPPAPPRPPPGAEPGIDEVLREVLTIQAKRGTLAGDADVTLAAGVRTLASTRYGHLVLSRTAGGTVAQLEGVNGTLSRDGSLAAVVGHEGDVRLYRGSDGRSTGVRLPVSRGKRLGAPWLEFSPDGNTLLVCFASRIELWDAASGARRGPAISYEDETPLAIGPLERAVFSPDGKRILSYTWTRAQLFETGSGRPLGRAMRHDGNIAAAVFAGDERVVTAGEDGTVRAWTASGKGAGLPIPDSMRHAGPVNALAVSPDARLVASASEDGTARLWDAAEWGPYGRAMAHGAAVTSARFSADGRTLVTGSRDGQVRLWAVPGRPAGRTRVESLANETVFSPDGRAYFAYDSGLGASLRSLADGTVLAALGEARLWGAKTARFDAAGARLLLVMGEDNHAAVWDARSGKALSRLAHGTPPHDPLFKPSVSAADLSADGVLAATAGGDDRVVLWDAASGEELGAVPKSGFVHDLALGPAGDRLAVAYSEYSEVWALPFGKEPLLRLPHGGGRSAWSPDGTRLATASDEARTVLVWDARSGAAAGPATAFPDSFAFLRFSPDGRRVAAGSHDGTARLVDAGTGELVGQALRHAASARDAAFSPDGSVLATCGLDGMIRLWHSASGEPAGRPLWQGRAVTSLGFSPDGRTLYAHGNWSVQAWDVSWIVERPGPAEVLERAQDLSGLRLDDRGMPRALPGPP